MKTDIVIPIGTGSNWNNNELKYCLRSLEKNFLDLGNVYIVTQCDIPWLTNVYIISETDIYSSNKDGNLIRKVIAACKTDVSETFIRLSDDQLLLKPQHADDFKPYYVCDLAGAKPSYWHNGRWKKRLLRTYTWLKDHGFSTFFFDGHIPMPYNKHDFLTVYEKLDYGSKPGFCINTMYFNQVGTKPLHKLESIKATFESDQKAVRIDEKLADPNNIFAGYSNAGLNEHFRKRLKELFPDKSKFEK